ncbi:MAG: winged helix-turn-helix transcriptional regulator [Chloroflexi bacterium]|nr:winged helix-turn-helix transcriptional regulator [Chloroflexota bacterium]
MAETRDTERLYDLHAAICKSFANPWRLRIVEALGGGELTVSELVERLGIPKSNVSQHLGLMREKGVVEHRRDGAHVFYRLANPKVLQACRLMREVLLERFEQDGRLSRVRRSRYEQHSPDKRRRSRKP